MIPLFAVLATAGGITTGQGRSGRFWSHVDKANTCWLWRGRIDHKGYGRFGFNRTYLLAHRFAYELVNGPIPSGLLVLHKCDNPPCVNPDHLFTGTHHDNVADKIAKGRQPTGSTHHSSKLTAEQVENIRARYGSVTRRVLANEFGISRSQLSNIAKGRNWKHEALNI